MTPINQTSNDETAIVFHSSHNKGRSVLLHSRMFYHRFKNGCNANLILIILVNLLRDSDLAILRIFKIRAFIMKLLKVGMSYILLHWSRFIFSKRSLCCFGLLNFFSLSRNLMILIFLNRNEDAPFHERDNQAASALSIISRGSLKICSLSDNKADWSSPLSKQFLTIHDEGSKIKIRKSFSSPW